MREKTGGGMSNTDTSIDRFNVGRIAERIVSNELEARGFRVSELDRRGLAANADLLAGGFEKVRQVQLKEATNTAKDKIWWVQYGYCTDENIQRKEPMFNRRQSFYKADVVVLVAVRSPSEYRCVVLPVGEAEKAAQFNLERRFRSLKKNGGKKKPGKVWTYLDPAPREDKQSAESRRQLEAERAIIQKYVGAWKKLEEFAKGLQNRRRPDWSGNQS